MAEKLVNFKEAVKRFVKPVNEDLAEKLLQLEELPDWFNEHAFLLSVTTNYFFNLLPRIEVREVYDTIKNAPYFELYKKYAQKYKLPVDQNKEIFHPEGLFSEQIFGPVESGTCQCGLYDYVVTEPEFQEFIHNHKGTFPRCPICGVEVGATASSLREVRMAVIELPKPRPFYIRGSSFKKLLAELDLLSDIYQIGDIPDEKLEELLLEYICNVHKLPLSKIQDDEKLKALVFATYTTHFIPVIPPALRPLTHYGDRDSINRVYISIIRALVNYLTSEMNRAKQIARIFHSVHELHDELKKKWSSKEGFSRGKLQGKRIAWSGRAYVVPKPELPFGYIEIPLHIAIDIFHPLLSKLAQYSYKDFDRARELSQKHFTELTRDERKFLKQMTNDINTLLAGELVYINRQPTLHVPNIQGVYIRVYPVGKVIKLSNGWWHEKNLDYDGDSIFGSHKIKLYELTSDNNYKEVFEGPLWDLL